MQMSNLTPGLGLRVTVLKLSSDFPEDSPKSGGPLPEDGRERGWATGSGHGIRSFRGFPQAVA